MADDGFGSNLKPEIKAPAPVKAPPVGMPKTVKIILEENENIPPNGQYFGLNGRGYLLRPGEVANVPPAIIEILDHAIMSAPVIDSVYRRVVGYRSRLRYPYRIME